MSCKYLVSVFLFCGVAVMGASVVNVSSSSSNDSLLSNSTIIRPKLVLLNHTALNSTKAANVSDSKNKTELHVDVIKTRAVDSVLLKNLSALNSSHIEQKSNASVIDKAPFKALNSTAKASNATVNSSSKVERAVKDGLNSTLINKNGTKNASDSASIKLTANTTSSSNSSKIVVRAVVDKDAVNSTKALNASSTANATSSKIVARAVVDKDAVNSTKALNASSIAKVNATTSSARNSSAIVSSSSNKTANATDKATTVRPVQLLKANDTTLTKGNSAIRLLRRRQVEADDKAADAEVKEDVDTVDSSKDDEAVELTDE